MKYTINPSQPYQFAYDSPTYLEGITEEDIVGLDYGQIPILDDMIYVAKGEWIKARNEYGYEEVYDYFLMIKRPKDKYNIKSLKSPNRYPECYITPITWTGSIWSIDRMAWMLATIEPGYEERWWDHNDYRNDTIIREWAVLKEDSLEFLNWLTKNPLEVKN